MMYYLMDAKVTTAGICQLLLLAAAAAQAQPAQAQLVQAQAAQAQSVQAQPAQAVPAGSQPAGSQPAGSPPAGAPPAGAQPSAAQPAQSQPGSQGLAPVPAAGCGAGQVPNTQVPAAAGTAAPTSWDSLIDQGTQAYQSRQFQ